MAEEQDTEFAQNLDGIMRKVKGLIAVAEHPETDPTVKKKYQEMAKRLIKKYQLHQEHLIAQDQLSVTPILRSFDISRWNSFVCGYLHTLFLYVAEDCDVQTYVTYERKDNGQQYMVGKTVGYEIDLRFLDLLWSSIRLSFIGKLDPEVDPKLTDEENIYRLRSAGIARKDVAEMLWGKWTHSNSAKVGKVYKEECRKRGEEPALDGKGIHLQTFKEAYAREFVDRVQTRLWQARSAVMAQGGDVVFANRDERVKEKFYEHFPHLRPKPVVMVPVMDEEPPTEEAKKARKRLAYWETAAYRKMIERKYESTAAIAGAKLGKSAGDDVNISRIAPRTERLGYEHPEDVAPSKELGS